MKNVSCAFNLSCLETTDAFSIFKETENVFRIDIKFIETRVELWEKEKWYFRVLPSFGSVKTIRNKWARISARALILNLGEDRGGGGRLFKCSQILA